MMKIFGFLKKLFGKHAVVAPQTEPLPEEKTYTTEEGGEKSVVSVWDILQLTEHTQAFHLVSVIRFDEWVPMEEIRRRIIELFQIDYQNERSLYPYLKTMVDLGLIESTNIGGKRKWRKKDLLVKIDKKKAENEEITEKEAIKA